LERAELGIFDRVLWTRKEPIGSATELYGIFLFLHSKVNHMKCLICGKRTDGKILCLEHSTPTSSTYGTVHECTQFMQTKNESERICQFALVCQPIKSALKGEPFVDPSFGRISCPHQHVNRYRMIKTKFTSEQLKPNYGECLD